MKPGVPRIGKWTVSVLQPVMLNIGNRAESVWEGKGTEIILISLGVSEI